MEQDKHVQAGFGLRFLAFGIDMFIYIVGIMFLTVCLNFLGLSLVPDFSGLSLEEIMSAYQEDTGRLQAYNLTLTALNILFYAYFESSDKQATPGKQLIKIKVVGPTGKGLTLAQALMRNAGKIISQLILYVGFFMCLFTKNKQCLHDLLTGSFVIRND